MATSEQQGGLSEVGLSHIPIIKSSFVEVVSVKFIPFNTSRHWATIIVVVAVSCCLMHLVRHLIKAVNSIITKPNMIKSCNVFLKPYSSRQPAK